MSGFFSFVCDFSLCNGIKIVRMWWLNYSPFIVVFYSSSNSLVKRYKIFGLSVRYESSSRFNSWDRWGDSNLTWYPDINEATGPAEAADWISGTWRSVRCTLCKRHCRFIFLSKERTVEEALRGQWDYCGPPQNGKAASLDLCSQSYWWYWSNWSGWAPLLRLQMSLSIISFTSSSVISWRPKDPGFGWSTGSCLMLSTPLGLWESRESFWGSAGVTKALLGIRDGDGSLRGPPEEVWGGTEEVWGGREEGWDGMVKVWRGTEEAGGGIVEICGRIEEVWGEMVKVWRGIKVWWVTEEVWEGMEEEVWRGMEEVWGNIKEVWRGAEEGGGWWRRGAFWVEGPQCTGRLQAS